VLISLLAGLTSTLRTRASLQVEILALRHQPVVLQRNRQMRVSLRAWDRLLWVALVRLWPEWRQALMLVKPETVVIWCSTRIHQRPERCSHPTRASSLRSQESAASTIAASDAQPDRSSHLPRQATLLRSDMPTRLSTFDRSFPALYRRTRFNQSEPTSLVRASHGYGKFSSDGLIGRDNYHSPGSPELHCFRVARMRTEAMVTWRALLSVCGRVRRTCGRVPLSA